MFTDINLHFGGQGTLVPTVAEVAKLRKLERKDQMDAWKANDHSQHCIAFHLDPNGCKRNQ